MKKLVFTFFIFLLLPITIFSYSKNIIPGGESIGIQIQSDGLIVVGYYKVNDEFINKNIKINDRIIRVNNKEVISINDLTNVLNDYIDNEETQIEVIRNNKNIKLDIKLLKEDNVYKTGLYVKDTVIGVGTLTYIDPISKIYGSLGHEILLSETNSRVEVKDGNILLSSIKNITKSRNGYVGSKNASISFNKVIGNIEKNNSSGIYGHYLASLPKKNIIEIANFNEIEKGNAYILTVTNNDKIQKYNINILDKYYSKKDTNKAFSFEVVDSDLISVSGGIVQGMSGSPIIQNNRLIGAVTNVVIDNVTLGYGISIITMLEEGDKLRN